MRLDEKRRCEASYEQFVRSAWGILEPDNIVIWNWHMSYFCDIIQEDIERIAKGIPRTFHRLINVPPSSGKSMFFTRLPNAWAWIDYPWMRFLSSSYAGDLSLEHSSDTRIVIESDWYQSNWGDKFHIMNDQNSKSFYRTERGGRRQTTSTGAKVTGRHAHIIPIDDPISAEEAESLTAIEKHLRYYKRTLKSRFIDPSIGCFWVIMQRLHEDDLSGHILKNEKNNFMHICLPARDCDWVSPSKLRKLYVNGLLFPKKFPEKFLKEQEEDKYAFSGQYMQRPAPEEGGMFKRQNWRFWVPSGSSPDDYTKVKVRIGTDYAICDNIELPRILSDKVLSWDFSFEDSEKNDPVAGFPVAKSGANIFILNNRKYGNMDYALSCDKMIELFKEEPDAIGTLVEQKALGHAIIQDYRDQVSIIPVKATKGDSPHSRAQIASRFQRSGNMVLPHPDLCPWVKDVIDEFAMYRQKNDKNDQITSICQAAVFLKNFHPVFPAYKYRLLDIKIPWRELEDSISLYISQWVADDTTTSIIVAAYNSRTGNLAIIGEWMTSNPFPELIKPTMNTLIQRYTGGIVVNSDRFEWYGSPNMFGHKTNQAGSTRLNYQREGMFAAYSKNKINLTENLSWELNGALLNMNGLILGRKVLIDQRAPETARQFASWNYDGESPDMSFGCALAACNIVSVLYESGKMDKKQKVFRAYSQAREQVSNKFDQMGAAGEFNIGQPGDQNIENNNSWMGF